MNEATDTATIYNDAEPVGWVWDRAKHSPAWVRATAEEADYCLNVLPPIMFAGGFAVSEPIRAVLMVMEPLPLMVPPMTSSSGSLCTGMLSPVIIDSST